jgi:hypothetical protein
MTSGGVYFGGTRGSRVGFGAGGAAAGGSPSEYAWYLYLGGLGEGQVYLWKIG